MFASVTNGWLGTQILDAFASSGIEDKTVEKVGATTVGAESSTWKLIAPTVDGMVILSVKDDNTSLCPSIAVYKGSDLGNLTNVVAGTGAGGHIQLSFSGKKNTEYLVAITGYQPGRSMFTWRMQTQQITQCAPPTFSVSGSLLTISTSTSGASIIYRGSHNTPWRKYDKPLKMDVSAVWTIYAKAIKNGFLDSLEASYATG
jgi:hypothetical protein